MEYKVLFDKEKLPDALNKDMFEHYFKHFKEGDMVARDIIINHNIRLVILIVKNQFSDTEYEFEDLVSIGILGLIKAVDSFDISKNKKISSYASRCIENEIRKYLRDNNKHRMILSLDAPVLDNDDYSLLKDLIIDDDKMEEILIEGMLDKSRIKLIKEILNSSDCISDRERNIFEMWFGLWKERTYLQREIAQIYNITPSYVSRIIVRVLRIVREQLLMLEETFNDSKTLIRNKKHN